jgi:hypothetical protein
MTFYNLFSIPLFHKNIAENPSVKEKLLPKILEKSTLTKGTPPGWDTTKINTSFGHTEINDDLFQNNEQLNNIHVNCISEFFSYTKIPIKFVIYERWYNLYHTEDFQEEHHHISRTSFLPSAASFIHFLSFDPKFHNAPTFKDPSFLLRLQHPESTFTQYSATFSPEVNEGDFLIFPSYLLHSVKSYSSKSLTIPRVTISGNVRLILE